MACFSAFFLSFVFAGRRRMTSRFHPTPCEMNVKRSLKPTAEPTKTKEKLKNPQEPNTRAVESQEGLKDIYLSDVLRPRGSCRISRRVERALSCSGGKRTSVSCSRISRRVETIADFATTGDMLILDFGNTLGSKPSLRILLRIHHRKVSAGDT